MRLKAVTIGILFNLEEFYLEDLQCLTGVRNLRFLAFFRFVQQTIKILC